MNGTHLNYYNNARNVYKNIEQKNIKIKLKTKPIQQLL